MVIVDAGVLAAVPDPDVKNVVEEVGATGVTAFAYGKSIFGSVLYNFEDYNPDLHGQKLMQVLDQMRLSDGEIASSLFRIMMPMLAAEWKMVADPDDPQGEEKAAFCEKWIMGKGRRSPFSLTWLDFLRHALLMLPFGFSAFEKVWGVTTENPPRQVYAKIAPRLPKTIWNFLFDEEGRLGAMTQRAFIRGSWKVVEIPANKIALFVFAREGDNFWGRSILRGCYKAWFHKSGFEILDGIAKERNGVGLTIVTIPAGAKQPIKDAAEKVASESRAHERQGFVLEAPMTMTVTYPTGTSPDIIASIKYHDEQISQTLMSEFMHLGASQSGSRATAQSKIELMLMALQGLANMVEDTINVQLIPDLIDRNPWQTVGMYPKIECEDLTKMSGDLLATVLAPLMKSDVAAITPGVELEDHIREGLKLPAIPDWKRAALEDQEKAKIESATNMIKNPPPPVPSNLVPLPDKGGAPDTGIKPAAVPKAASEKAVVKTFMLSGGIPADSIGSPVTLSRAPKSYEVYAAFSEMKAYLRDEPQRIWHRIVEGYRSGASARFAYIASRASDADLAAANFREAGGKYPMQGKFANDLAAAFLSVYMSGRRSVLEERARQLGGTPVQSAPIISMVDVPQPDGEEYDDTPTKDEKDWVATLAASFVGGILGSMALAAKDSGAAARQAGTTKKEEEAQVRAAIDALSPNVQMADLAGAVTRTFTTGRDEQADTMQSDIEAEYYSAIMDDGTCDPCAALDGQEQDPGAEDFTTPNPECLGGDRCRCVTIYVFKDVAKAAA